MELSPLALLGIALATMFFGYGFGLFEGRGQGYKRRRREEEADKSLKAAAEPPPAPRVSQPVEQGASLLKLGLDEKNQPILDLDGQRVDVTQLTPLQRKRLIDLMINMRPWVEGGAQQPFMAASRPAAQPVNAASQSMSQPRPAPAAASATQPPPSATPSPAPKPAGKPLTMVEQIDDILQKKLVGTPLAERGVRMIESPEGGVAVFVGLDRYAGVGEVPDAEVQALIRAAIAEWEKKYTPG